MAPRGRRRQIFLYLISVVLPSSLLIAFTLRLIDQDRELAQKRLGEERQRRALEIGRDLSTALEEARRQAVDLSANSGGRLIGRPIEPPLILIGEFRDTELIFPWQSEPGDAERAAGLREPGFLTRLSRIERIEFFERNPARAARLYRDVLTTKPAFNEAQAAMIRLSLARTLYVANQPDEANKVDRDLLSLPADIQDEHRIPFSLYAAERLTASTTDHGAVLTALNPDTFPWYRLAPGALLHGRDILLKIETASPDAKIRGEAGRIRAAILEFIAIQEQAESMQKEFPSLDLRDETTWKLYGRNPWFVGGANIPDGRRVLAVCDAGMSLSEALKLGREPEASAVGIAITGLQESDGLPLGRTFPNARLVLPPVPAGNTSGRPNSRSLLSLSIVALALMIAVFGSYLFWKDIRRDLVTAEMRSQFVASVSHELKTPLAAIRMFAETLRMGRLREPEKREEYLETIVNESQRLDRLLANVLDFSKIEQGKRDYRFEKTSLSAVLESAARAMDYPLRQKGFDLRMRAADGIPDVPADRDALLQAVLNLLDNAMKYSGDAREIDLILEQEDAAAAIRVQDHGMGIPESEKQRIFEKFYRVPDSRNAGVTGAGLGLTLAAHIAAAHGGRIDVQSRPGEGSVFSIILPLEIAP